MSYWKTYLLFLCSMLCCLWSQVGIHASGLQYESEQFYFRNYTDEDGLPQNSVQSIVKDELGYLWMITQNGLVKFDGVKFRVFQNNDLGTKSPRFTSLVRLRHHHLMYAYNVDDELVLIEKGIPRLVKKFSDEYNKVENLFKIKTNKRVFFDLDYNKEFAIFRIDTNRYYTLRDFKFSYYENGIKKYSVDLPREDRLEIPLNSLFLVKNRLYFTEYNKMYSIHAGKIRPVKIILDGIAQNHTYTGKYKLISRYDDKSQNYLITDQHLYHIYYSDENTIKCTSIINNFPFGTAEIKNVFYDHTSGTYYIGSDSKGLFVFSPKKFQVLRREASQSNVYYGQIEYKKGYILTGYGSEYSLINHQSRFINLEKYNRGWYYSQDKSGNIWTILGTRFSVFDQDLQLKKIININYSIGSMLYVPQEDRIYATEYSGPSLISIDAANYDKDTFRIEALLDTFSMFNLFNIDNKLYITSNRAVYEFDLSTRENKRIKATEGFYIRYVYKSTPKDSIVWFCMEGKGIFAYNGKELRSIPLDKNGYLLSPHAILEDSLGNFWISTNKGLFKVKKEFLYNYLSKGSHIFYQYFNKSNGFLSNEFNGGGSPCALILSDGRFSFSSMEGLVLFDPKNIVNYQFTENITINKVLNGDQILPISDEIVWSNRNTNLSIELSTPYFGSPEDILYHYKLNKNKNYTTSFNGIIQFNSLPVGDNVLEVLIPFENEKGTITKKIIKIKVPPYWYETNLFYFLLLIGVIIILYLIYIYRVKILEKENIRLDLAVKNRTKELVSLVKSLEESKNRLNKELYFQQSLNSNISHNIKTPLRYLMNSLGKFHQKMIKHGDERYINESRNLYTASQELYNFTEQFVAYMKAANKLGNPKIETVYLHDLVNEVMSFYSNFIDQLHFELINLVPPQYTVDAPKDFLRVIFSNFIDNSIKHASATKVIVSGGVNDEGILYIQFLDDGLGIDEKSMDLFNTYYKESQSFIREDYIDIGIGLFTIKEMLPYVGAHVEFKEVEKGALIEMQFKTYSERK